jgi:hypothetical protein
MIDTMVPQMFLLRVLVLGSATWGVIHAEEWDPSDIPGAFAAVEADPAPALRLRGAVLLALDGDPRSGRTLGAPGAAWIRMAGDLLASYPPDGEADRREPLSRPWAMALRGDARDAVERLESLPPAQRSRPEAVALRAFITRDHRPLLGATRSAMVLHVLASISADQRLRYRLSAAELARLGPLARELVVIRPQSPWGTVSRAGAALWQRYADALAAEGRGMPDRIRDGLGLEPGESPALAGIRLEREPIETLAWFDPAVLRPAWDGLDAVAATATGARLARLRDAQQALAWAFPFSRWAVLAIIPSEQRPKLPIRWFPRTTPQPGLRTDPHPFAVASRGSILGDELNAALTRIPVHAVSLSGILSEPGGVRGASAPPLLPGPDSAPVVDEASQEERSRAVLAFGQGVLRTTIADLRRRTELGETTPDTGPALVRAAVEVDLPPEPWPRIVEAAHRDPWDLPLAVAAAGSRGQSPEPPAHPPIGERIAPLTGWTLDGSAPWVRRLRSGTLLAWQGRWMPHAGTRALVVETSGPCWIVLDGQPVLASPRAPRLGPRTLTAVVGPAAEARPMRIVVVAASGPHRFRIRVADPSGGERDLDRLGFQDPATGGTPAGVLVAGGSPARTTVAAAVEDGCARILAEQPARLDALRLALDHAWPDDPVRARRIAERVVDHPEVDPLVRGQAVATMLRAIKASAKPDYAEALLRWGALVPLSDDLSFEVAPALIAAGRIADARPILMDAGIDRDHAWAMFWNARLFADAFDQTRGVVNRTGDIYSRGMVAVLFGLKAGQSEAVLEWLADQPADALVASGFPWRHPQLLDEIRSADIQPVIQPHGAGAADPVHALIAFDLGILPDLALVERIQKGMGSELNRAEGSEALRAEWQCIRALALRHRSATIPAEALAAVVAALPGKTPDPGAALAVRAILADADPAPLASAAAPWLRRMAVAIALSRRDLASARAWALGIPPGATADVRAAQRLLRWAEQMGPAGLAAHPVWGRRAPPTAAPETGGGTPSIPRF